MKVYDENKQKIDSAVQEKVASLRVVLCRRDAQHNEAYRSCLRYRAAFILQPRRHCRILEGNWKNVYIIFSRCQKAFMLRATVVTGTDFRVIFERHG